MNEHINIRKFSFAPLHASVPPALKAIFTDMPDNKAEEMDALMLKGKWPPSKEAIAYLEKLTQVLGQVEEKTGIKFDSHIVVIGGNPGHFSVSNGNAIKIDFSVIEHQILDENTLEGILLHEAAHAKHHDVEKMEKIGGWIGRLQIFKHLSDFYHDEPDRFVALVKSEFGGMAEFKENLQLVLNTVDREFASLQQQPDFHLNDIEMARALTESDALSDAIMRVQPVQEKTAEIWLKTVMAFQGKSKKELEKMKVQYEQAGLSWVKDGGKYFEDEYSGLNVMPIPEQDKHAMDTIETELLAPLSHKFDDLVDFHFRHIRAEEYRADDFAVLNASQPQSFSNIFSELIRHVDQQGSALPANETIASDPGTNKMEFAIHPPIEYRRARAGSLAKRVASMREMCHIVDVPAAIEAVTNELLELVNGRNKPIIALGRE